MERELILEELVIGDRIDNDVIVCQELIDELSDGRGDEG